MTAPARIHVRLVAHENCSPFYVSPPINLSLRAVYLARAGKPTPGNIADTAFELQFRQLRQHFGQGQVAEMGQVLASLWGGMQQGKQRMLRFIHNRWWQVLPTSQAFQNLLHALHQQGAIADQLVATFAAGWWMEPGIA